MVTESLAGYARKDNATISRSDTVNIFMDQIFFFFGRVKINNINLKIVILTKCESNLTISVILPYV